MPKTHGSLQSLKASPVPRKSDVQAMEVVSSMVLWLKTPWPHLKGPSLPAKHKVLKAQCSLETLGGRFWEDLLLGRLTSGMLLWGLLGCYNGLGMRLSASRLDPQAQPTHPGPLQR